MLANVVIIPIRDSSRFWTRSLDPGVNLFSARLYIFNASSLAPHESLSVDFVQRMKKWMEEKLAREKWEKREIEKTHFV